MRRFLASILLFFVILQEIKCPLPSLPSLSNVNLSNLNVPSVLSMWSKNTSEAADKNEKEGVNPVQKDATTMTERFQNMLFSHLPDVSDEMRLQFLVALKVVLGNSIPMGRFIIIPVIDQVIAKYATKVPASSALLTPDTTDALIFKLMSQKVDDGNLNEFLEIGADSYLVKKVTARFMKSLQEVADNYVDEYMRDIKNKVEKKLTA